MNEMQHSTLADGRWAQMPLAAQMGNIGSEISRAIRWKEKGKMERMDGCVDRALELIDLSISAAQSKESRYAHPGALRELARLRETVCDFFLGENEYRSDSVGMMRYFDQFALI